MELGRPVVVDGTGGNVATTTMRTVRVVNWRGKETWARSIVFRNEDTTNALKVGYNGVTAFTILAGQSVSVVGMISAFTVQSAAGTAAWTAIVTAA